MWGWHWCLTHRYWVFPEWIGNPLWILVIWNQEARRTSWGKLDRNLDIVENSGNCGKAFGSLVLAHLHDWPAPSVSQTPSESLGHCWWCVHCWLCPIWGVGDTSDSLLLHFLSFDCSFFSCIVLNNDYFLCEVDDFFNLWWSLHFGGGWKRASIVSMNEMADCYC